MAKVGFPVLLGWQRQAFQFYWDSKGRLSSSVGMAKAGFPVLLGWQRQAFQFCWDGKGRLSKLFFFPLTCWWASMVADWESAESLLSAETESPQGSEVTSFRDWESTGIRDSLFQRLRVHRGQRFPLSETESPQGSEVPSFRDWESTGIRGCLSQARNGSQLRFACVAFRQEADLFELGLLHVTGF